MHKTIKRYLFSLFLWTLAADMALFPALAMAKSSLSGYAAGRSEITVATPATNALPVLKADEYTDSDGLPNGVSSIDETVTDDSASMVVNQTNTNVVVKWNSFNVGENASVVFDQDSTNWSVLNYIYDEDPSAIFGQLSATGRVFLINSNGILFGESSQVNVHTLVATSLYMDEDTFLDGSWKDGSIDLYINEDYADLAGEIVNQGYIAADSTGSIFLVGSSVTNEGTIETSYGQVELVAGTEVSLEYDEDNSTELYRDVTVTAGYGTSLNAEGAAVTAEMGHVGMYGSVVNQNGLIKTVTALERSGQIELRATERIETGANSQILAEISTSDDAYDEAYEVNEGYIALGGIDSDYPDEIVLNGEITAPSASVIITADDAVTLTSGAVIDVSGVWSTRSASENELEVQLNSVELADSYYVRQGDLLGETIYVNALDGTTLGHIDGYLSEDLTAEQRFAYGGTVKITANDGSITLEEGSSIDFSGGGYHYTTGEVNASYVRLGNKIWDVSEVPDWALEQGDELELVSDEEAQRLGLATTKIIQAYDQGDDAGSLTLDAVNITLKGDLDGSVVTGVYQDSSSDPEDDEGYQSASGHAVPTAGTLTLGESSSVVDGKYNDYLLANVTLTADTSQSEGDDTYISSEIIAAAGIGTFTILADGTVTVNDDVSLTLAEGGSFKISAARILYQGAIYVPSGTITLETTLTVSTGDDEYIIVDNGSVLSVAGTQIDYSLLSTSLADYYGSDALDGGTITITGSYEATDYVLINDGALLDVSGGYAIDPDGSEVIGGDAGTLSITGLAVILEGEIAGYALVGQTGGTLELHADNLVVVNDTADVPNLADDFAAGDSLPDAFVDTLYLSAEQIQASGFSSITLKSFYDTDLASDLSLSPSTVKYSLPLYLRRSLNDPFLAVTPVYHEVEEEYLESSSLTIKVNQPYSSYQTIAVEDAILYLASSASLSVTTGGTIDLEASQITIEGTLTALGGTITLTTGDSNNSDTGIVVAEGAEILVQGCVTPQTDDWEAGTTLYYDSEDGGSVVLESLNGSVAVEENATIDVSGGDAVVNTYYSSTGVPTSQTLVGDAGSISITGDAIVIDTSAYLVASTAVSGSKGGDLTLSLTSYNAYLELDLLLLQTCQENGFDAVTIQSVLGVDLQYSGDSSSGDAVSLALARQLVFDTPLITTTSGLSYDLYAPYVQVINTLDKYQTLGESTLTDYLVALSDLTSVETDISLTLSGLWLEMTGQIAFDGISDLNLAFVYDILLSDQYGIYDSSQGEYSEYVGALYTLADLTIAADRIYPTSESAFTIQNGYLDDDDQWVGGEALAMTGPGDDADRSEGTIYSAGGTLEIVSNVITLSDAYLAAPMGQIIISGLGDESSILVGDGTTLTAGSDAAVSYGTYTDGEWMVENKDDDSEYLTEVEAATERAISLTADTVVTEEGSEIDISGGGTLYAYEFSSSVSGTNDPLASSSTYVILADNSVQLPGLAIYLEGVDGLSDGWYTLLDESYAFVDGAIIIEDLGTVGPSDIPSTTSAGDAIAVGILGYMGTGITSGQAHLYSVRLASDVLEAGQYDGSYITAGDGGTLIVEGTSTTLSGSVSAAGLDDYSGGSAILSATNIYVGDSPDAETLGLENLLLLGADFLSDSGFSYVQLGVIDTDDDEESESLEEGLAAFEDATEDDFSLWSEVSYSDSGSTQSITIEGGSLSVDTLALFALDSISITDTSTITADELLLVTAGTIDLSAGSGTDTDGNTTSLVSVGTLGIFADAYELSGTPEISEALALGSARSLALVRDATDTEEIASTALVIGEDVWQSFTDISNITLVSEAGVTIYDGIDLSLQGDLEIHTSVLALATTESGQSATGGDTESDWNAENISLYGSSTTVTDDDEAEESDLVLKLTASDTLAVYGGNLSKANDETKGEPEDVIRFQGISSVSLTATNDMIFGVGTLETGNGDLTLTAARITSTYELDDDDEYQVGDFTIDAGTGTITTLSSGTETTDDDLVVPGGSLTLAADTIVHGGVIDILGGQVTLSATGTDEDSGVYLTAGSEILAKGGAQAYDIAGEEVIDVVSGGVVAIESASGIFEMAGASESEDAALIDVSNAYESDSDAVGYDLIAAATDDERETWADSGLLDAGTVVLDVAGDDDADDATKSLVLEGTILGMAAGSNTETWGEGGAFSLDAYTFDLDEVANLLDGSGFDYQILLRSRSGDLTLSSGSTLTASQIQVVADTGAITIAGTLDASGRVDDRVIALYAGGTLTLEDGSLLDASGTDSADGGEVTLSSTADWVDMLSGSAIDVSGAEGGTVTFVAGRYNDVDGEDGTADSDATDQTSSDNDVKMNLYGTIYGASRVTAEAVASYEDTVITDSDIGNIQAETSSYMSNAETNGVENRLIANLTLVDLNGETLSDEAALELVHLTPHVEIYSTGDLELSSDLILSGLSGSSTTATEVNDWRYGDDREAGVLTLRAAGDLTIDANLADEAQDKVYLVFASESSDSWSYNLVAGADLSSAYILAVNDGTGDLEITDGNQVYTESGTIRFAAGNDVIVGQGDDTYGAYGDLTATISTYDGDIIGTVGRDLVLEGDTSSTSAAPAAIQTNTGDITLVVGRDVDLSETGTAIRTLGALTDSITITELQNTISNTPRGWDDTWGDDWDSWQDLYGTEDYDKLTKKLYSYITNALNYDYWYYEGGGDITITAGRDVVTDDDATAGWMEAYQSKSDENDNVYDPDKYTAAYTGDTFTGIGTLGGGDVTITAGGDVSGMVGTFGEGNLVIQAGGDLDGRFLVNDGLGSLIAMGSFGTNLDDSILELGQASISLSVQGDVYLGTILNTVFVADAFDGDYYIDYDEDSEAQVTAITGDLVITGTSKWHDETRLIGLLPPRVFFTAGQDVSVALEESYNLVLAPSSEGVLSIVAGGSVIGNEDYSIYGMIVMSAAAPEMFYTDYLDAVNAIDYSASAQTITNYLFSGLYDGFSDGFTEAFIDMWSGLSDEEKEAYQTYQEIYDNINSDLTLHEKDLASTDIDDIESVVIKAGEDITNLKLVLPMAAEISAGDDIINLYLYGQNNNGADEESGYVGDVTSIIAGGDISLNAWIKDDGSTTDSKTGITLAGPGWLIVSAGGSIDLGATEGIQTVGQDGNENLDSTGATILLSAGYGEEIYQNVATGDWAPEQVVEYFTALRDAGLVYSAINQGTMTDPYTLVWDEDEEIYVPDTYDIDLDWLYSISKTYDWAVDLELSDILDLYANYDDISDDDLAELAEQVVDAIRENLIDTYLALSDTYLAEEDDSTTETVPFSGIDFDSDLTAGAISMVQSQVVTTDGGSIYVMVADSIDVGLSAFGDEDEKTDTGINVQYTGDIGIYAENDINVNESRIMTWYGGDIILWSDEGSINAGKGSKTAVSLTSSSVYWDEELEQWLPQMTPPAVGSGIRLQTYDPDGASGPLTAANPGSGYLFAPDGDIDAGEAGIAGSGLLVFEAQQLLNAQNIESVGITIGVATQADSGANIGNLTGNTSLAETSNIQDAGNMMKSTQQRFEDMVEAMNDSLVPKWLAVEVIGFGDEEGEDKEDANDENKERGDKGECSGLTGAKLQKCLEQKKSLKLSQL